MTNKVITVIENGATSEERIPLISYSNRLRRLRRSEFLFNTAVPAAMRYTQEGYNNITWVRSSLRLYLIIAGTAVAFFPSP